MFLTNTDRVRIELENRIVDGTLAPGTTLDEVALCKSFQVSRTPVREALLQLSAEGFVRIVPRAGIYVVQLSAGELRELLESLEHLEGLCASLAAQRITESQLKKARYLQSLGKDALTRQDVAAHRQYDKQFQDCVYTSCGNGYLRAQLIYLRKRTLPYLRRDLQYGFEQAQLAWDAHQALLEALQRRDDKLAMQVAMRHVNAVALPFLQVGEVAPDHMYFGAGPRPVGEQFGTLDMPPLYLPTVQGDEPSAP